MNQFGALGQSLANTTAAWGNVGYAGQYAAGGFGAGGAGGGFGGGFGGGLGISSFGGMGDLTGTGFAIGAMGGDSRSKSHAIDAMINQLLAALMAGNLDVLETALTLCNQKAKMTLAGAAVKTVRAMQLYDRQMQQLSDQMGALAGQGNTQSMAPQLAQMNLQANQLSSGRQMIANNLKDLMTMMEEIGNTEKGARDTMARIKTTQSRWS
ncbi:MAG TPA: hypothetical protein VLJ37_07540 [bacterium]|nr:hypothetical protein [bacterium]